MQELFISEEQLSEIYRQVADVAKQKHKIFKTNEVLKLYKLCENILIEQGFKIIPNKVIKKR